jgi:hypothetical protein
MIPDDPNHSVDPEWADVVMEILPCLYRTGDDDSAFVYAATFVAVGVELERGARADVVRERTDRVLQHIDGTDRPSPEKKRFAALFARAVDDALAGRAPAFGIDR